MYLVQIQKFNNGDASAKALFEYSTKEEAIGAAYSVLASSVANANISSVLCQILDDKGAVLKYEYWERPITETPAE